MFLTGNLSLETCEIFSKFILVDAERVVMLVKFVSRLGSEEARCSDQAKFLLLFPTFLSEPENKILSSLLFFLQFV